MTFPAGAPFIPPRGPGPTEQISKDDADGWLDAAWSRNPPAERDRETLRNYLRGRNRWKYDQLQKLLRWAEKELGKTGLNPEDARWML